MVGHCQEKPRLDNRAVYDEAMANKKYKRRVKELRSDEENDFQRIQNLLIKRNSRAKRTTERKEEDNAKAKEGMNQRERPFDEVQGQKDQRRK